MKNHLRQNLEACSKIKTIFSLSLPVLFGYIPLGMAFGFLMTNQGFSWIDAVVFSLFAFAGAIQFIAISLFTEHANLLTIALTTLVINFRHLFYGISVFHYLPKSPIKKIGFIFCLTDENYSLLVANKNLSDTQALGLVFLNYAYWVTGTFLGAMIANHSIALNGIDFVLTALFTVLAVEQIRRSQSYILFGMTIAICFIASILSAKHFLFIAIGVAILFLYFEFILTKRKHDEY